MGKSSKEASRYIMLGLKDMAGNCSPTFMAELVKAIKKDWPELVMHYHRHYTDGLFVPAVGAAAKAGVHVIDTSLGAASRWYGQGETLSTAAYLEDELGMKTCINKNMVREGNYVLKQIMPFYDKYTAPYFQGIDYDVVQHGMPGGATSSSQEGALQQGYIQLLPHMLKFLAGTRQIVKYHDVTPGSQITWNTAFLAITGAYKHGGEGEVHYLLEVLENVIRHDENDLTPQMKKARLAIYQNCNDAFRDLLLGKFGKLPLGFPPCWVYQSAFGDNWEKAMENRTEASPLDNLPDINLKAERLALKDQLHREPSDEEFLMYLNHPTDALKLIEFIQEYGNPNNLPLNVWFEGLKDGEEVTFIGSTGKPHQFTLLRIEDPDEMGVSVVRYVLDSQIMSTVVQVFEPQAVLGAETNIADKNNPYHVAAPSNGDLWVMYINPGDVVKEGEELFNISIMKQEKAVLSPCTAMVKRVLKTADYRQDKQMIPVKEGELIVELAPIPHLCANPACGKPIVDETFTFCPHCGTPRETKA